MQRTGAWAAGALALGLGTVMGCAPLGTERAAQESPAHALAFEISAEWADTCTPAGTPRVLAVDAVEPRESVVARAHDGWMSLAYTSTLRGRVTLDLEPQTLHVLVARHEGTALASAPAEGASPTAVDANGHGLVAFLVPGPGGAVLAAAPIACARR
jgi:hypothetical protein